jgi:ribosomal protein S18 acetylase RimI-like enzyme
MRADGTGQIAVREGVPGDKAIIDGFLDAMFPHDSNRLTEAEFSSLATGGPLTVLVAEMESNVCGFIVLRDRGARPWTSIDFIGVVPHAARKGVGKALMHAAITQAPRPVLRLFVHASNAAARALYATMGFRHTSTKPSHYPNGEDAIVMMRWLGPRWLRGHHKQTNRRGSTP